MPYGIGGSTCDPEIGGENVSIDISHRRTCQDQIGGHVFNHSQLRQRGHRRCIIRILQVESNSFRERPVAVIVARLDVVGELCFGDSTRALGVFKIIDPCCNACSSNGDFAISGNGEESIGTSACAVGAVCIGKPVACDPDVVRGCHSSYQCVGGFVFRIRERLISSHHRLYQIGYFDSDVLVVE